MEIVGQSLDDALIELYQELPRQGHLNVGSRGTNTELLGVTIRIENPRARLSRSEDRGKLFSAIGELLWYLSGSDKLCFIQPYINAYKNDAEDGILAGAYGPRLFKKEGHIDQIQNVVRLLSERPTSRRAVIQLFDAEDIVAQHKEIPCTTTLQFHLREGLLSMSVTMRSNDAYWGLPHDVFCFTMLQEMIARRLGVGLGSYIHHAGSMHIYENFMEAAKSYVGEGYQRPEEMPEMPNGNPFDLVPTILSAESWARSGKPFNANDVFEDDYWADFVRMIQVHWARRRNEDVEDIKNALVNNLYKRYVPPETPTGKSAG